MTSIVQIVCIDPLIAPRGCLVNEFCAA